MRREAVLAAAVSLLGSQVATAQVDAVEWRVEDGGNGHWYAVVTQVKPLSWGAARDLALAAAGDLCCFADAEERRFTFDLASRHPDAWSFLPVTGHFWGPWVGAYQVEGSPEPDEGWRWLEATGTSFLPEDQVTLNNQSTCCGNNEDRLFVYSEGDFRDPALLELNDMPASGACAGSCSHGQRAFSAILEWSADCNADGLVDFGQIRAGELADANGNNIPDCCEGGPSCAPCPGDTDASGTVDGVDLAIILSRWGTHAKDYPAADTNGDGTVDGIDLATVLGGWGACP